MVLTNKQKEELDKSILGYFKTNGYSDAYNAFLSTLQSSCAGFTGPEASHADMLDKKWTSIIRMNKKIMELEAANSQLKEDLENSGKGKKIDLSVVLPREPAKLTLKGHRDGIRAVKFHPVYSLLATASEDATIKVWDYESGRIERTLQGHQDSVQDIDFNASGTLLASCSADLSIKLWNFEATDFGCVKTLQGHDHSVSCVVFLPSGDALLSASRDKTIKLWELSTGYCTRTFGGHDQWVRGLAVHPSGLTFVSASMDQTVKAWVVKTGELLRTYREHEHVVECVAFSNQLADNFILTQRQEEAKTNGGAAHGDASLLNGHAASSSVTAASSSVASPSASSSSPATGAGGLFFASASRDRTVRIFEVSTGSCVRTLVGHDNWVTGLVFHPSGRYLLSSSDDKSIRIWDVTKGFKLVKKLADAHDSFVTCLAWNQNQPMLASGSVDSTIRVWECRGPLFQETLIEFLGHGIFNVDGEMWRSQRKVASHMFSSRQLSDHMMRVFQDHSKLVLNRLTAMRDFDVIDMFAMFSRFTLDSISQVAFGVSINCLTRGDKEQPPFAAAFDIVQEISAKRWMAPPIVFQTKRTFGIGSEGVLSRNVDILNAFVFDVVRQRKANLDAFTNSGDLLSLFLNDAKTRGEVLSDVFLRDIVLNFLIAGRDTTASALSYMFKALSDFPDIEEKVVDEIFRVIGEDGEVDESNVKDLTYLEAVFMETVRLFPPVSIDLKTAVKECTLPNGTVVPAGARCFYSPYALARLSSIWGEDAEEFKPERWLDDEGHIIQPSNYKYPHFNAGLRLCLGKQMAINEAKVLAVSILQRHSLRVVPGSDTNYKVSVTLVMEHGLPMTVRPRNSSY